MPAFLGCGGEACIAYTCKGPRVSQTSGVSCQDKLIHPHAPLLQPNCWMLLCTGSSYMTLMLAGSRAPCRNPSRPSRGGTPESLENSAPNQLKRPIPFPCHLRKGPVQYQGIPETGRGRLVFNVTSFCIRQAMPQPQHRLLIILTQTLRPRIQRKAASLQPTRH